MDKKNVVNLAKSFSNSCERLVKDKQLKGTLSSPAIVLVSITVINLVSSSPLKSGWSGGKV